MQGVPATRLQVARWHEGRLRDPFEATGNGSEDPSQRSDPLPTRSRLGGAEQPGFDPALRPPEVPEVSSVPVTSVPVTGEPPWRSRFVTYAKSGYTWLERGFRRAPVSSTMRNGSRTNLNSAPPFRADVHVCRLTSRPRPTSAAAGEYRFEPLKRAGPRNSGSGLGRGCWRPRGRAPSTPGRVRADEARTHVLRASSAARAM